MKMKILWMYIAVLSSAFYVEAKPGESYTLTGNEKSISEIIKADMEKFPELYKGTAFNSYLSKFKRENGVGKRKLSPGDQLRFPETPVSIKVKKSSAEVEETKQEKLSKKQVKDIAEKYIEAILSKDYEAWSSLMMSTEGVGNEWFMKYYGQDPQHDRPHLLPAMQGDLKRIKIKKIKGNAVKLEFQCTEISFVSTRWLLLLPDGKIKYDAIYMQHPVVVARRCAAYLYTDLDGGFVSRRTEWRKGQEGKEREFYIQKLRESGVPLFEYNPEGSENKQCNSLSEILEWIADDGEEWDNSEPKVFMPKEYF